MPGGGKKANLKLLESMGFEDSCNPRHSGPLFQFCMRGKDTSVSKRFSVLNSACAGTSSYSWSQLSAAEKAPGSLGNVWIHTGEWLDVGMQGSGTDGKGASLNRDCSGSWHSNQSQKASTTWHLSRLSPRDLWLWFGHQETSFPTRRS